MSITKHSVSIVKAEEDLKKSVKKVVDLTGGFKKFIKPADVVLLKPNFNTADPFPASSSTFFSRSRPGWRISIQQLGTHRCAAQARFPNVGCIDQPLVSAMGGSDAIHCTRKREKKKPCPTMPAASQTYSDLMFMI
jgi:hypothetical protein